MKVQDGCDYGCAYCTIPMARGKSRNPDINSLREEAQKIAEKGIKEIVLTGVNIGDFGKSTDESFTDLLRALSETDGIERIRLSSVEPNLISDDLIEMVAENRKLLPHFHIPLQSGNDKILGLMRRRYKTGHFAGRVEKILKMMPLAGIGADVIVGFPGETESDFQETYSFIEQMPLSYLHIFTYSQRPGTVAESLPLRVSYSEKEKRSRSLMSLSESKQLKFSHMNIGEISDVLFEMTKIDGMTTGFTGNYLRVEYPWNSKLVGRVVKVRINGISDNGRLTVELL
jgi:threonylcarbamoyladenosine tRNA methylthiotransferase MtaB